MITASSMNHVPNQSVALAKLDLRMLLVVFNDPCGSRTSTTVDLCCVAANVGFVGLAAIGLI